MRLYNLCFTTTYLLCIFDFSCAGTKESVVLSFARADFLSIVVAVFKRVTQSKKCFGFVLHRESFSYMASLFIYEFLRENMRFFVVGYVFEILHSG